MNSNQQHYQVYKSWLDDESPASVESMNMDLFDESEMSEIFGEAINLATKDRENSRGYSLQELYIAAEGANIPREFLNKAIENITIRQEDEQRKCQHLSQATKKIKCFEDIATENL